MARLLPIMLASMLLSPARLSADTPASQPSQEELAALARRLDDPSFRVRQAATAALGRLPDYRPLIGLFKGNPSLEARLRIREAARTIFFRSRGFLGVNLSEGLSSDDPPVPVVNILGVLPDSPAAKAGLAADDAISHVDGVRIADLDGSFSELVASKPAGTKMKLTVLRRPRRVELTVTLAGWDACPAPSGVSEAQRQFERAWTRDFEPNGEPVSGQPPPGLEGPVIIQGGMRIEIVSPQVEPADPRQ